MVFKNHRKSLSTNEENRSLVNLSKYALLTKIIPMVNQKVLQEITKDSKITSHALQASLPSVKVRVCDSINEEEDKLVAFIV